MSTLSNTAASASQTAYILALLTAGGGIAGYARAHSVPSLVAGVAVGALYALGAYRLRAGQAYGAELALAASVVLAGASVPRAVRSGGRAPVPLGLSGVAVFGVWRFGQLVFA